jgi:hypothetical protein
MISHRLQLTLPKAEQAEADRRVEAERVEAERIEAERSEIERQAAEDAFLASQAVETTEETEDDAEVSLLNLLLVSLKDTL